MSDEFAERDEKEARTLFKDDGIFSGDYEPQSLDEVIGRKTFLKEHIERIVQTVKDSIKPKTRAELYVYGMTGLGKTLTVRAVLNSLPKEWKEKFEYVWVNCKAVKPASEFQVLREIATQLDSSKKWRGKSRKDIEDFVIDRHKGKPVKPLLVVVDEGDVLVKESGTGLLYSFFKEKVNTILISNDFGWTDYADVQFISRAMHNGIEFPDLEQEQMFEILRFVCAKGLKEGVMNDKILAELAEQTVERYVGDARIGKSLIYASVKEAQKEGVKEVTEKHLAVAYEMIKPMNVKDILTKYSKQDRMVLMGFACQRIGHHPKHGGHNGKDATTNNLLFFYEKCAKLNKMEPVGVEMMRKYLDRLEAGGIVYHLKKNYPSSGRTSVYYLNEKYRLKDVGYALIKMGIKPYTGLMDTKAFFTDGKVRTDWFKDA